MQHCNDYPVSNIEIHEVDRRTVTSELHEENDQEAIPDSCDGDVPLYLSRYEVHMPFSEKDDDRDDLSSDSEPPRRRKRLIPPKFDCQSILIYHARDTSIPNVGLQLWKACLLLADYMIFRMLQSPNPFDDMVIVEYGCGCGLVGIVVSLLLGYDKLIMTDYTTKILQIASKNVKANEYLCSKRSCLPKIRLLDWSQIVFSNEIREFDWTESDQSLIERSDLLIIGADIVYDNDLTEAFLKRASQQIFSAKEQRLKQSMYSQTQSIGTMYVALEKRFNFEVETQSIAAHGYHRFLQLINVYFESPRDPVHIDVTDDYQLYWRGSMVNLLFPQYFLDYDRNESLELWEIKLFVSIKYGNK